MVPSDGKFFFANDVMQGFNSSPAVQQEMDGDELPRLLLQGAGTEPEMRRAGLLSTGRPFSR